jgi:hypothetical protein
MHPKVGANIDAWCTKCKLVLAHTIEAIAEGSIKRVNCNTCHGVHQYKSHAPGEKESYSSKISQGKKPMAKAKPSDFTRLMSGKDISSALSYCISDKFAKGMLINHAIFGVGVVVEEKDTTKIEVLFESGSKILAHAKVL